MENTKVIAKSYLLKTKTGEWLGQIVLTSDGMFSGVTDYGNMSFAWRSFGQDFRQFIISLNVDYFGSKMYTGMGYIIYGKKYERACHRFAEKILPPLQEILKKEIECQPDFIWDNAKVEKMKTALEQIAEGKGRYSSDPLTHADNTIQDLTEIAKKTLNNVV